MLEKLWFGLTRWPPRDTRSPARDSCRVDLRDASGQAQVCRQERGGKEEEAGGRVQENGDPDALDGKKDEWLSKVVLLRSPWQLGHTVTHPQETPQTSCDLNGFANDKVE